MSKEDFEFLILPPLPPECGIHQQNSLCSAEDGTQGFVHTMQALNQLDHILD